jgi:hypothetical protein
MWHLPVPRRFSCQGGGGSGPWMARDDESRGGVEGLGTARDRRRERGARR